MKKLFTFLASIKTFLISFFNKKQKKKSLIIILMGAPGAGKGTHATKLKEKLQIPHISPGEIFRHNVSKQTPIGLKAKAFIEKGLLVPDELVLSMIFERLKKRDCRKGFILDGFPRTINQAKNFSKEFKTANILAINIDVKNNLLIDRLTKRIICKQCGAPFHKQFLPPKKEGICDFCGGELYQRKDDSEEVVKERILVYNKETKPLIDFYNKKKFYEVDGSKTKQEVFCDLLERVEENR